MYLNLHTSLLQLSNIFVLRKKTHLRLRVAELEYLTVAITNKAIDLEKQLRFIMERQDQMLSPAPNSLLNIPDTAHQIDRTQ